MIPGIDILNLFAPTDLETEDFTAVNDLAVKTHGITRREGLLALDGMVQDDSLPLLFRKGLEMVVDGTDPDQVKARLSELIHRESRNSRETARNILYMQSILSLQQGESEGILKMRLAALRGIEALSEALEEYPRP